jgi:phage terminase large subunit
MSVKKIEATKIFFRNLNCKKKVVINLGGARSSKSYSIAQLFVIKFINERGKNFLVSRKTLPALRITAYKLIIDLLKLYGYYDFCHHNKTERTLTLSFPSEQGGESQKNWMLFTSIDDPEKIKSTEFNYIWMEEANEFTFDDYLTLYTRLSGKVKKGEVNQIFLSLNPTDQFDYINTKLIHRPDVELIHSTYLDNPTLDNEYIRSLKELKDIDENSYRIFALGEYGRLEHLVFPEPWPIVEHPENFDEIIYGIDFGYTHPTAVVEIGLKDSALYVKERLYETHMTNQQLILWLQNEIPEAHRRARAYPLYCDSAEPNRIQEIYAAGFNALPSDKHVWAGLDFLRSLRIFSHEANINLHKERQTYKWRQDKNGDPIEGEPVSYNDHLISALRYAAYTHLRNKLITPKKRFSLK